MPEQAHVIERFTRINVGTLQRVVTVEDPAVYAKPFSVRFTATLGVGDALIENICFAMPPAVAMPAR